MKLGNGIGLWPSIGLMIEDRQISLSVVATTPQGRKEIVRETQPCEEGGQAAVLEQMLAPWTGPKMENGRKSSKGAKYANGPWVQIALPESRIYNAVVPITSANQQWQWKGEWWAYGATMIYSHTQLPNRTSCVYHDINQDGRGTITMISASSNHPGGVNVLFMDGSVRFVQNSVNYLVWYAIATPNYGEVVTTE